MNENRIRELREARGWTRSDLVSKSGCTYDQILNWEGGRTIIPEQYRAQLARVFGVSRSYLMRYDEDEIAEEPEPVIV